MNVYDKLKAFFRKNIFFDEDIYGEYILRKIDEEELLGIIKTINLNDDCFCGFNIENATLNFNRYEIFTYTKNQLRNTIFSSNDIKKGIIKVPNELNYFNLFEINHELEHAKQLKTILNDDNYDDLYYFWYLELLKKDIFTYYYDEKHQNGELYSKFHDYFYSEYSADIESEIEVLALINSFNNKNLNKMLYKINLMIARRLLDLYTDIDERDKYSTPFSNSIKLYKAMLQIMKFKNYDHFKTIPLSELKKIDKPKYELDRLRLGLSISSKTMNHINNVATNKDKTLNLYNDIRNI